MNDKFHLEINSFEDFVVFVSIIRGKELDSNTLKELAAKLSKERIELSNAVKGEQNA